MEGRSRNTLNTNVDIIYPGAAGDNLGSQQPGSTLLSSPPHEPPPPQPSLHQGLPLISFTTLQWEVVKLKPEQDCIERRPWGSGGGGAGRDHWQCCADSGNCLIVVKAGTLVHYVHYIGNTLHIQTPHAGSTLKQFRR